MMEFANPQFLVWLWLVPLVAVILIAAEKSRRRRIAAFAGARVAALRLLRGRAALKLCLRLVALTATVLALAGPRWGFAWQNVKRQGADIMLVVDVSKSMLATDVDPDRLTRARRELVDFLGLLQGDRVGLVAFAGEAFVQCPLTEDYGAARMFIDLLTPDLIPVQGTDLGRAIDVAIKGLDDGSPSGSEGRAIVLITDGEDQEGRGKAAAERLKDSGVKLYTIGIGSTAGGPIPEAGGGFKKDANGEVIMTKPDEPALQAMALASGGMYVRSVAGDMDLRRLYTEGIRAGVGQKEISSGREKLWFERYQWLLLLAFLALIIDQCVMDVRSASSRRGTAAASALGLLIAALGAAGFERDAFAASGREAFQGGDYPTAAAEFQAEEVDSPDEPRHAYNRALSQFKAGQFGDAAQGFERAAALASEPRLKQDSWFNLGNARVGAGKLPEAKAAYEQALALDPGDRSSRENLEYVKKLLEEEQKQKEQQKQDQKENQDQQQDKQDQQDQKENQDQQQDQKDKQDQQQNGGEDQKPDDQKSDEQQKQDKQSEQEKQAAEQQAEQEKQEAAQQAAAQQSSGQEPKDMKDMDQQEAERLLQSVEDQATKYHYRPEGGERGSEPKQSAKDW